MTDEVAMSISELETPDNEKEEEISSELVDFYLPDELVKDSEDSNPGPSKKKKICTPKIKKTRMPIAGELKGMKSYELRRILDTDVVKFCQEMGLIATNVVCSCGKPMLFKKRKDNKHECLVWACRWKEGDNFCHTKFSIRRGSWFENSKMSISEILWLVYMWLYSYSLKSVMHECNHSNQTVTEWFKSCQEVCQAIIESKTEPLGGINKRVEIYDVKYSGSDAESQWVLCALEQLSCKTVLVVVKDRSSESLIQFFDEYILPESTILSNIWSCFQNCSSSDLEYLLNQKSIKFYDTVSKSEIKNFRKMRERASRPPALNLWTKYVYSRKFCEQIYRKSLVYSKDAFLTFLQDVALVYTPATKHRKSISKFDNIL